MARGARSSRGRAALGWLLSLALLLVGSGAAVDLVRAFAPALEVGRAARLEPRASLLDAVAEHPSPVFATLYLTEPERMPSQLRGLEDELLELFARLERASGGRLSFALVHPDRSEEARAFAAARGVAERRVRRIERDGWSEALVFSTVELAGAAGRTALLEGLVPDDLDDLQARLEAHLDLLAEPVRPRIALSAPTAGYRTLRSELARGGDVQELDLLDGPAADAALGEADLFVWVAPTAEQLAAGALERLGALLERGASAVVAASAREDRLALDQDDPGATPLATTATSGVELDPLWGALGLVEVGSLLLDEQCDAVRLPGRDEPLGVPFLVRAIAPNQDFRRYPGQPNASLVFPSPAALALDEPRLLERGWRAHALATSGDFSFAPGPDQDLGAGVPVDRLTVASGRALPKLPLLVELEPQRASSGRAVVAASARFLHDEFLAREDLAQRRALRLVLEAMCADERLVAARGDDSGPPRFAAPSRTAELGWRAVGLALPALALLLVLAARGARSGAAALRLPSRASALATSALLLVVLGAGPLSKALAPPRAAADAQLEALARRAAERGPARVELVLSPSHRLPPDLRAAAREASARLAALAAAVDGLELVRVDPTALAPAERAALPVPERTVVRDDGRTRSARRVRAGLVVRAAGRVETVEFEDAGAFALAEFRLAHALWRALEGRRAVVGVASSTPRLSSAEAHLEYQQLQLFAPTGSDVFSAARERLARDGFEVRYLDADRPETGGPLDALVWLQPRRSVVPVLRVLVDHLAGGGGAFVAGQAHELVARQLEGRELELVHWPRPTVCDLDALWFADVGVTVDPALLFDRLVFTSEAEVRVDAGARGRRLAVEVGAPAFQVRVSSSQHTAGTPLEDVGDLPWYGGDPVALDELALARRGLEAKVWTRASRGAWIHRWEGGYLGADVLAGTGERVEGAPDAPLVVEVRGRFPGLDDEGRALPPEDPVRGEPARLVVAGSSALFTNGRLADPRFGARELLTAVVADLALPPELARLAAIGERPRGLGLVAEPVRLGWRAAALAAAPLLALLLGLGRLLQLWRRSGP